MNNTVFVRFVFESPYINSFINHYKHLGFKTIIILFHENYLLKDTFKNIIDKPTINSNNSKLLKETLNKQGYLDSRFINDESIVIHPTKNYKNKAYKNFRKILPSNIDWLLVVDSDEFLIINNQFRNITELINSALKTYSNIQCIQFKWIWLTNATKSKELTMSDMIKNYNCYENKKINNTRFNIKTMHRYNNKLTFGNHFSEKNNSYPKYLITTYLKNENEYFSNKNKLKYNSINENTLGFLLHIRIRSFYNLIFKTFNNYGIKSKNIARKNGDLFNYFTYKKHSKIQPDKCFMRLYNYHVFDYEKRHINNIHPLQKIILHFFNNSLDRKILFTITKKEEEYIKLWMDYNFSKCMTVSQLEIFKHNIHFYNDMFKTINTLNKNNKKLQFLLE